MDSGQLGFAVPGRLVLWCHFARVPIEVLFFVAITTLRFWSAMDPFGLGPVLVGVVDVLLLGGSWRSHSRPYFFPTPSLMCWTWRSPIAFSLSVHPPPSIGLPSADLRRMLPGADLTVRHRPPIFRSSACSVRGMITWDRRIRLAC